MVPEVIYPPALNPGDTIAIVSPAGIINPDFVAGAEATLRSWGYDTRVAEHALRREGTYAGTCEERLADITRALLDPSVRAILCSRGGYGAVHLLDELIKLPLRDDPKWLIGFSDISVLHALMRSRSIVSVHASMTKQLTLTPDCEANRRLRDILRGERPSTRWASHPFNHHGEASGQLIGGNLSVLQALIGTPFDSLSPAIGHRPILFIEDIAEPIYKVERMLWQLRLNGTLERISALIVGRFTLYEPDRNHPDMATMIRDMLAPYPIPVAFNAPIGHIGADNLPLLHGAPARLTVTPSTTTLTYSPT